MYAVSVRGISVEIESVGVGFDVTSETSRPSDSTRPVPVARLIAYRRGQRIYERRIDRDSNTPRLSPE